MDAPVPALATRAEAAARRLREAEAVLLASHIDADGLTSAAIATTALERADIPVATTFEKQLDEEAIAAIAASDYETVLFTDFGSGQLDVVVEYADRAGFTPIVADHHQPADADAEFHVNPLLEGIDGGSELSGAGAAYVLARALADCGRDPEDHATDGNRDLAALAVVGAVGDMQTVDGELVGANARIVEEGVAAGVLDTAKDLAMYGTQTRPLPKLLEYANDVRIPGITNDQAGAVRFLDGLDLDLKADGDWRTWADLTHDERQTVVSALVRRAVRNGVPASRIDDLIGTSYTLPRETAGTVLRDASEFSTLLNATARYDRADVGLAVCLGERGAAFGEAERLLRTHRRNLSQGIEWVADHGVTREDNCQWFHAEDEIRETIVGIIAGMAFGADGVDRSVPMIAFAHAEDGETKVSARGNARLLRKGLDLSAVMQQASRAVGGDGGGHAVAAGATVPRGKETAFVEAADRILGEQLR
ncbi:Single-stranded DNA-specific exonuclease RecJ [Halanaeroarchaeum sp. HSR-CO]|uniref:DHH family phosphoesterase n=1 Tax=Halanaeroarchaeum sp. HSR-CO TaxID=2866382 RepID=UPI00217EEA23|nr:DHH family phosphoesterase [Halanaeroarchaeum sp. HSR-CO]UWG46436.1 Single-stranded DNA-specific exonuclease RecJ [Halanaeroarchaeum sp. HSR-CO]